MNSKKLHIIAFNVPFPPDYGGVIDVFYKIKALHALGVSIHLHVFLYNRPLAEELYKYCDEISTYERKTGFIHHLSPRPYIVQSRRIPALLENLQSDNAPILFEGTHCTGYLNHRILKDRLKVVRAHNIEWQYYRNLAELPNRLIPGLYYRVEWRKLRNYERHLSAADHILAISPLDKIALESINPATTLLPPFHGIQRADFNEEDEGYVLFQGDLSVPDNEKAVNFILKEIATELGKDIVIAGRNPSMALRNSVNAHPWVRLVENPDQSTMELLIQKAKVNLLLSFQTSGMKLKLLNALFLGKHCLANKFMLRGTNLDSVCHEANGHREIIDQLKTLLETPWTRSIFEKRTEVLETRFMDKNNAAKLLQIIWPKSE